MERIRRRLVTFPLLFAFWALLVAAVPITVPLALLVGLIRRRRFIFLRLTVFAVVYASLELLGLGLAALAGLHRKRSRELHYALQTWWAWTLFRAATLLLELDVRIEGEDAIAPGPIVLLLRHTSLADALLPAAVVTRRTGIRLRYVLKRELLVDPCLDLVGNRLPNHFIDRSQPTEEDMAAIAALASDLKDDEGVIIYPEGTRFTEAKRARILEKMQSSLYFQSAQSLEHTLPPRAGGVHALVRTAPKADVVFCAHTGFEGFATLADVLSGEMVGRTLRVAFWRVPASEVPHTHEELTCWLYERWKEVDRFAGSNQSTETPSRASAEVRPSLFDPADPSAVS